VGTYGGEGEVWGALGDRTRRSIVLLLAEGPSPVGKLADALPVSRPAVSQHLRVLNGAGLVDEAVDGRRRIYRLNEAGMLALRDQLDAFGTGRLATFVISPDNLR
jgi:DNA-binding transcriptional ArsR family regulator